MTNPSVTTRNELFLGLFTTALEGGIGYWSQALSYHWCNDGGTEDYEGFNALVVDTEEHECLSTRRDDAGVLHAYCHEEGCDGKDVGLLINRDVIAKGYRLATSPAWRNALAWSSDKPPLVITEDTDWDYDAGDADMIVQLGLFDKVVFG